MKIIGITLIIISIFLLIIVRNTIKRKGVTRRELDYLDAGLAAGFLSTMLLITGLILLT